MKEVLENKYIVGQNLKFDLQFLYNYGIIPRKVYDTMIVEQLLYLGWSNDPAKPSFVSMSLANIAKKGELLAWIFYCGIGASSGVATVGREWMLACDQALDVAKWYTSALMLTLGLLVLGFFYTWTLLQIVLVWLVPQWIVLMACCTRMGLLKSNKLSPLKKIYKTGQGGFAIQSVGLVALSSLDVFVINFFQGQAAALSYVLITRVVFIAFPFAISLANPLIAKIHSEVGYKWSVCFAQAVAIHAGFSGITAIAVSLFGAKIFLILLDVKIAEISGTQFVALFSLGLGRAIVEAGFQLLGGESMANQARWASLACILGLILLIVTTSTNFCTPLCAAALGWAVPAAYYCGLAGLAMVSRK